MQELVKLKTLLEAGVTEVLSEETIDLTKEKQVKMPSPNLKIIKEQFTESLKPTKESESESRDLSNKANSLEELKKAIENFTGCGLKKTAKSTVFSDGQSSSKIMLIGEAPGASEDEQGIPFCGVSGKLLDDSFRAIDYTREKNLYITNSVFWRPPGNRRPTDEEIAICRPFVEKHIALIKPKLIVLVGSTALNSLLPEVKETISKVRGRFLKYKNQYLETEIDIMPIFHPSYLLRQSIKKKICFDDMLNINSFIKNA